MKAIILLRMPVDKNEPDPPRAAFQLLSEIVTSGLGALREKYAARAAHPLHRWIIRLDEASGIIELRDR